MQVRAQSPSLVVISAFCLLPSALVVNPVQHILIWLVRLYRWTLSPAQTFLFGPLGQCRFTPSCSQYAAQAIQTHGSMAGG